MTKTWKASLARLGCAVLTASCTGGQTGEMTAGGGATQCPTEAVAPETMKERYEGEYETAYSTADEDFTCLPVAGQLSADIRFREDEAELELKPCGAAWYPVTVQLHNQDESLDQTVNGYLSEDGQLELEDTDPMAATAKLDAQGRTLSFSWQEPRMVSVKDCCDKPSERETAPFALIESGGVLALQASSDDLGVDELHLAFSFTPDLTPSCLDTETYFSAELNIAILDEDEEIVAELPGAVYAQAGQWLSVSSAAHVPAFNAPELSTESQAQVFGLHFEASIPLDQETAPTVSLTLDVAQDGTKREVSFRWKGKP